MVMNYLQRCDYYVFLVKIMDYCDFGKNVYIIVLRNRVF